MKKIVTTIIYAGLIAILISGKFYWDDKVQSASASAREVLDSTEQVVTAQEEGPTTSQTEKDDNQEDSQTTSENKSSSNVKASLADIKSEYTNLFKELENTETSKVDQLAVQAKADALTGQYTPEELQAKYQGIFTVMEENADTNFNLIYDQLQEELKTNDYQASEASAYKTSFKSTKQARKERMKEMLQDLF